jgi:hypothetical protein
MSSQDLSAVFGKERELMSIYRQPTSPIKIVLSQGEQFAIDLFILPQFQDRLFLHGMICFVNRAL